MIVTLTLNPSLDRTFILSRLRRGELNRAIQVTTDPAGKGVNVSKALHANAVDTVAVFPHGGGSGSELLRLLKVIGIPCHPVPIEGVVRGNVSVVEADGTVTKLNEPGPYLTPAEIESLVSTALGHAGRGGWLVASGNLPMGAPADTYGRVADRAFGAGVRFALDSSGEALANAVTARPNLIKPNLEEMRQLTTNELITLGAVIEAAQALVIGGVHEVLVSLGSAGAVLAGNRGAIHGRVMVDELRDTVGAGDALLAGFLAGGDDPVQALQTGLGWARTALRTPGTSVSPSSPEDFAAVTIMEEIDLNLRLDQELDRAVN